MANPLSWLRNGGLMLLLFVGFLVLLWGSTAPVGTLVWWLDRGEDKIERRSQRLEEVLDNGNDAAEGNKTCYIIYLTGVGDLSADDLSDGETVFLAELQQNQPQCILVRDVFPYSAANQDVSGQRIFDFLKEITEKENGWEEFSQFLLEARNVWRMALSADNRYGRIYNRAIALTIVERMDAQQSIPISPDRSLQLILMGKSGGAQVALGATPYLSQWLNADITVISFGGMFNGNEGFEKANHVYHLRGERDWIETIGGVVLPSRWHWTFGSPYNRARREDRYTVVESGSHAHQGDNGYFGTEKAEEGVPYVELTLEKVNQLPIWSNLD
ncbi:hypothetical protein H6G20_21775 [Desertifilum sp. FACHB-1129]|uniref:Alpha/beta hydrolase n=1 Tax=Desertifilum tharense IPPAS B-1220 TaxID=1781255 RepID=A0A1E5QGX0_9CYAN|nr:MULTISPECIES: hypothetical protein [Desertifilum]MDA0211854.1 hypothetical protein [Cyanobacteria bacterium FC1]MBD2314302.1 hypothetical protein [Desertifilum sp. FACHB-1129]MBD2320405.1 hypothetical protein [Desertifilum sp. FACHB-866]MBD2330533.1 hypothetical protein [Desertifilum sp. FACHB-868]OEJ73837.1 hypothetical protein BH720_17170 [Desertifilum tharense IPPAS B-1220]